MKKSEIKRMIGPSYMRVASAWFRSHGPAGYELPWGYAERERIKGRDHLGFIVSAFARSLEVNGYCYQAHPTFDEYAKGVLASPLAPKFVKEDSQILTKYPPTAMPGLGPGLVWKSV